jgi:nicotinamidase-related amidase
VIVGVSTDNSVETTARTAGNLGFSTIVVSDPTFTFDKPNFVGTHRSAEDVHLMALVNLHSKYAEVMSCDDVLRRYTATEQ